MPLTDKFLYRALVRVNAYKYAKFQLPSSISYWDMKGLPKYKLGAADLLRRPLADKFLQVAIVPANGCQRTKLIKINTKIENSTPCKIVTHDYKN